MKQLTTTNALFALTILAIDLLTFTIKEIEVMAGMLVIVACWGTTVVLITWGFDLMSQWVIQKVDQYGDSLERNL
jgi:hypothetical protein